MTVFSYSQLEQLWLNAGGSPSLEATMAAIAEAESSGNSNATGKDSEKGLWQIDPHYWPSQYVTYDPLGNAKGAVHVEAVQGLGAWSTYNSGLYKQFLQSNTPPTPVNLTSNPIPTVPGLPPLLNPNNIPGVGSNPVSNPLDPNQWIQAFGKAILSSLGLPSMKELLQRLGLILLGAVILFIGIQMLAKNIAFNPAQSAPAPPAANPAPANSARNVNPGASGTGTLSSEALEAAAVALWLAHLSTLSALA